MTGVSCDPQQRNVIISRFYRSFYRGEPSPDFSPSRVTSTPLDDRIQKRWASFYKSATYISYIYVRIERRWTIVVCFLFASPSIRWPRCSGTEDRIRWKNLRISFFEVSVWRFVKRVYLNNIRKWNRLVCRFACLIDDSSHVLRVPGDGVFPNLGLNRWCCTNLSNRSSRPVVKKATTIRNNRNPILQTT